MPNSAFSPSVFTAGGTTGQGEINIVTNPSAVTDASTGWTSSSVTLSRVASGSPLDPTVPTGFQAVSTTTTTSFISTVALSVPTSLRNRKLKVQFNQALTDSSMWKIDVFKSDNTTRYTLSTDSSSVTVLPALTGTFTTTFDMDTDTAIYVRFTRYAGAGTSTLNFTNLIVGPGIQPQGFAGQEWLSYTPTVSNLGTGSTSTNVAYFRRLGSSIEVKFTFTKDASAGTGATTVTVSLPSNLNIDFTKISTDEQSYAGTYDFRNGSAPNTNNPGSIKVTSGSTNTFYFQKSGATVAALTGADFPGTARIEGFVTLPIADWAGSGTVQLAQNDTEWVYNSTAWGTANTSSGFSYGPQGASITGALTTEFVQRVRFQTPIQTTDILTLEFRNSSTDPWLPQFSYFNSLADSIPGYTGIIASSGVDTHGAAIARVSGSNTDVDVFFGRYVDRSYNGTAMQTKAWASGGLWRVRKSSAGAAVGFGLADANSSGLVNPYTTGSGIFYNGTYTPTLTAVSGTPAGTVQVAQYVRLGKLVYVSGIISGFSFGALNNVEFRLTVPIARNSNFSASVGASGVGVWARGGVTTGGISFQISPYTSANNQVTVYTTSPAGTGAADVFAYNFSYLLDF